MLPENILKSDVLDILFENRNKSYGAYALRKYYPHRLKAALAGVAALTILLMLLQQFKPRQDKHLTDVITEADTLKLIEVTLEPNEQRPRVQPAEHLQQATVNDNITVVVPDVDVKDTLATIEEINVKVLGNVNAPGELTAPGENAAPVAQDNSSGTGAREAPVEPDPNVPIERADVMPQFPGGTEAFQKFMHGYLIEPDDLEEGKKIVVLVKFIVQADGSISGAEILQSGRPDLDKEVISVVTKMPKWIPGFKKGRNVAVYFKLPVTFVTP